ncbi:bifunctional UDP-N-acetylmuramoyl-tripeptide:D-alanyl-D-alanine ligase/alanine racemase [Reichenbachiella sp. 5M10]|uniref:bifunctional UDP-N-acetylmuramoyl-tripeptide:D-alanyl-D-alanine ligase/alanine racemase n=1 Tax=Reichenbachiella sp. 5M10 TaxID=1889772 RepID=UPI000C15DA07|nr:bifunctional UDP-N-acetylmuramoyl-tripeptide:D-alanyl-D-alanine ligase/alanine racemase [Reichenbachiella sp. 5M10]PIB36050.1 bifunctional UDP-N-acetylmuramoyl-tripeptide:D-alanyl-D-alanine ligase/alanine racemase [Reichenbachiella sp. 5M10]
MRFNDLEKICKGKIVHHAQDAEIKELVTDTRNISIRSGVLFFAIEGINHDGHGFVQDAYDRGVRCFVVEKEVKLPSDANVLEVRQSLLAMQQIAADHRSYYNYPVVGITGSNGKTIVKEWLAQMLGHQYGIVKSPKSYNSQLGVPLSVWQMSSQHNLAIFEAGISECGEMKRLERIIRPTLGIFTNIGEAHNAGFQSLQEKANEKAMLFAACDTVVYCSAYPEIAQALREHTSDKTKLVAWSVVPRESNTWQVQVEEAELTLKLRFSDPASVENGLHCAVMMHVLGFGVDMIQTRLDTLSSVKMRLEMKQAVNRSYVIDDTYNNDLYGLEVALDFLHRQNQKNKKTVILSDLYQTGLPPVALYKRIDDLLRNQAIHRLIAVGPEISKARDLFHTQAEFYDSTDQLLAANISVQDEIVLVKGARDFQFEKIVEKLEYKAHGTVLEINMESLTNNLNSYRAKLRPEVKIMVMVKAFAYGGGNFEIANLLQFHKVDYLGVAYTDEALELRKNGIHIPIMIMNPSSDSFRFLKEYNLEPEIYSLEQLIDFLDYFEGVDALPGIHIKLETGMNRLGFKENELKRLSEILKLHKKLKVKSVFSHMAGSEDPRHRDFSLQQGKRFDEMSTKLMESLWYKPMRHIVNTAGIDNYREFHFDMVRLGIGLYGYDPVMAEEKKLQTVGILKTHVSQVKEIATGESIGYGRLGFAQKDMKIAIVPIGYADGYIRAFGNGVGQMTVQGQRVSTVGNICMDMTMLDVTGVNVRSGEEVIVFGEDPTIKELSSWIGTIPYEILTNISQRVKRTYVSG